MQSPSSYACIVYSTHWSFSHNRVRPFRCLQACNAAVQTTHLLRMLAALLLAVLLRVAKSIIYGEQQIAPWQRPLTHLYDVPPVILLGVVQLSAIGVVAWQSKTLPSCIPETVSCQIQETSLWVFLCCTGWWAFTDFAHLVSAHSSTPLFPCRNGC